MTTQPSPIATNVEHRTDALRRSGVLGDGRIVSVVVESSRTTVLSWIVRLRLTYAGAPSALILKTAHPDRSTPTWNAGRQEVAFTPTSLVRRRRASCRAALKPSGTR